MSRRIFLRGLGGACVAAPFLGSIAERTVKAEPAAPPRRLIVMYTHYGCITTRFFPQKSHGPLTAADLEPTTLKHLAPYVDKLLMPRGIRAMNEWTAAMDRGQGNDRHLQVNASFFTCHPVTPNSDDPFSFAQETKFNARPTGPSLDHVIARQLSPDGEPLFMRVGNFLDGSLTAISYSAPVTPYPGLGAPAAILAKLTGLFTDPLPSPDTYRAIRGKSIIDLVRDDLDTLARFDMSQADRHKLEAWKALLHDTVTIVASGQCTTSLATALGATQDNVDLASTTPSGEDVLTRRISGSLDGADLYSNLAVLAAACNANPVIVLKYPPNYVFRGLGMTIESATLSHRLGDAARGTCIPGVIDMLLTIDDYHARKLAHLVAQLSRIDEGDGTLLDNSAVVWFQDVSDGCARNLNNLPIVQVGSAGGYFKTGWAVNVEDGSPDLTTGNSEIVCGEGATNVVDMVTQSSGTDPSLANAPINKYYCNLMNALGVKAGADGFPAPGGSAPVTHFGMYDRTEDFIGGGINPPTIHDPGEFAALRATS
ncbi:DUF1552 domain-containing protein [Sorangium sp. So ce1097]|uniref:DUF1552 domain-containing protein n=1 Tax=Sorangium sp. So ce1097 TaxID=3133330 RepID=UPI003F6040E4